VVRQSRGKVQGQEEEVLHDDRGAGYKSCCERRVFLQAGPGEVDIEE